MVVEVNFAPLRVVRMFRPQPVLVEDANAIASLGCSSMQV